MPKNKKKKINVVCLGGGSGLSHLARGIKYIDDINLTCIVTVADNGGSTGILKDELSIPAMGDIRNVLLSLSNAPDQLDKMFGYRFDQGSLKGHSLGNIMIAGLYQSNNHNFVQCIESMSNIFNITGRVIPSTEQVVEIQAILDDNSFVFGESSIGNTTKKKIKKIFYNKAVKACIGAVEAIKNADIIIYSIGSLYTSVIPNIIIPEINQAIKTSKAIKVYFSNLMTQAGETENHSLSDHIEAINNHLGFDGVDVVVIDKNQNYNNDVLNRYAAEHSYPVVYDIENINSKTRVLAYNIAWISEENKISHSKKAIRKLLGDDISCLFQEM